jgi:hypothetical protein
MENNIQVTISIGDKRVTLAGPEAFVRSEVQRLTNMIAAGSSTTPPPLSGPNVIPGPTDGLPATEREFVAAKKPSGHPEIVAVLAYFLTRAGQTEFTPEDIRRAYARASQRPPKVVAQALRDARNVNDYLETGAKRGTFRLSPHGARTVEFDLPRKTKG